MDRHTTSPLRSTVRGAVRGAALPVAAAAVVIGTLAPTASSAVGLDLSASHATSYHVLPGQRLSPDRPVYVLPVQGDYHLTARFGESSGLWAHLHTGLDFAAPTGRVVRAITRGTVLSTGYDGSYGNKIVVRLASGTQLWFCHLSEIDVAPGQRVETGTHLGLVGSTGNTTGPHLHLEVRPAPETPVDPEPWLRERGLTP